MTTAVPGPAISPAELSCYTAALGRYLEGCSADPLTRIARSVRLAVRTDPGTGLIAFSHHGSSLAELGGECHLEYRGTGSSAVLLSELDRELGVAGGALAVTYTAAMSWSDATREENAPHFVLVSGHDGERWRIDDPFAAQLPSGYQESFTGWIPAGQLVAGMTSPGRLDPVHRLRRKYVFGFATPLVPDHEFQWLARSPGVPPAVLGPGWITDPSAALSYLGDFLSSLAEHPARARYLDDMWASARHHAFRYAHLLSCGPLDEAAEAAATAARDAWTELPMALRFAVESAARGRSRPSLVRGLFGRLTEVEQGAAGILAARRYRPAGGFGDPGSTDPAERRSNTNDTPNSHPFPAASSLVV